MGTGWIQIRTDLWNDPRVEMLADALKRRNAEIIGALFRLWSLGDIYTIDGVLPGFSAKKLDKMVQIRGFSAALLSEKIGWLEEKDGAIMIPNFDEKNGDSAKTRLKASERQRKGRSSVTKLSQKKCDKAVTREEKRREEKKRETPLPPSTSTLLGGITEPERTHLLRWWNFRESTNPLAPASFDVQVMEALRWTTAEIPVAVNNAIAGNWSKLFRPKPGDMLAGEDPPKAIRIEGEAPPL